MATPRTLRDLGLVILLLGIPVLLLRSAAQDPHHLSPFDRAVRRIGGPLEAGLGYAATTVGSFFERWLLQARLQEVNQELAGENRQLRLRLRELLRVEEENRELRRSLQMRDKVAEDMLAAEVTAFEQSPFFRVLKLELDRGDRYVRPGMAVLADTGVVGRIDRVADDRSDVMLITDPRSKVAVEVARTRAAGILEGVGEDACAVVVASETPAQVGDLIQTTGADDLFPKGHPVGQVVKVEELVGDQQRLSVLPAVRFDRLNMAWVILASAPAPDTMADQRQRPGAARGLQPLR
ncbi:MAG: rod shape-determining protein MreC [Myxococcales bacterium]|nr:rod shape-determining protein MreC [Myxococcales bacterium]MCB9704284.1 rod shape-determining protein MreC [Myxococcales bacterium]